jgi:hypothetical protein
MYRLLFTKSGFFGAMPNVFARLHQIRSIKVGRTSLFHYSDSGDLT